MQLNKQKLNRILRMDDESLSRLVAQIAAEAGLDGGSAIGNDPSSIAALRAALSSASNEDLERFNRIYGEWKRNRGQSGGRNGRN